MNFVIDVGNTTISTAVFKKHDIVYRFLFKKTYTIEKEDLVKEFINIKNEFNINHIVYSSVVPNVDEKILSAVKEVFNIEVINIKDIDFSFMIKVKNHDEVGSDLLADIYAARVENSYPCLVIDLGTANKYLLLDKDGIFSTCLIGPGMTSSFDVLFGKTALLKRVEIDNVPGILEAKETSSALIGGLIYSTISAIEGIANRYEEALGYKLKKIITGGNVKHIKNLMDKEFICDDSLVLRGLNYLVNKKEGN